MDVDKYNRRVFEFHLGLMQDSDLERWNFVIDNSSLKHPSLVPYQVEAGYVVLNFYPGAVGSMHLGDDCVTVNMRFNGKATHLVLPYHCFRLAVHRIAGHDIQLPTEVIYIAPEANATVKPEASKPVASSNDNVVQLRPRG